MPGPITLADLKARFQPERRTGIENVLVADLVGRIAGTDVGSPSDVPGHDGETAIRQGGDVILTGHRITVGSVMLLAAAGVSSVYAYRRPQVAIVPVGDAVVPAGTRPLPAGASRAVAVPALAAIARAAGGAPDLHPVAAEAPVELLTALTSARDGADLLLILPGPSADRARLVASLALLGRPGVAHDGIAIEPGSETVLGDCDGVPVVLLPCDPLAAIVVGALVCAPLIELVGGLEEPTTAATISAALAEGIASTPGFLDAVLVAVGDGIVHPLAGDLPGLATAAGLVLLAPDAPDAPARAVVQVHPI